MTYLWRRTVIWTTWKVNELNRVLNRWNAELRERAVVSQAELVVQNEQRRVLNNRLTGKEPSEYS